MEKPAVDLDWDGAVQSAQIFMVLILPSKMIGNIDGLKDPVITDKLAKFLSLVRPVKSRGDKNGNSFRFNSGVDEFFNEDG